MRPRKPGAGGVDLLLHSKWKALCKDLSKTKEGALFFSLPKYQQREFYIRFAFLATYGIHSDVGQRWLLECYALLPDVTLFALQGLRARMAEFGPAQREYVMATLGYIPPPGTKTVLSSAQVTARFQARKAKRELDEMKAPTEPSPSLTDVLEYAAAHHKDAPLTKEEQAVADVLVKEHDILVRSHRGLMRRRKRTEG